MWDVSDSRGGTFSMNTTDISDWAAVRADLDPKYGKGFVACTTADPDTVIGTLRYIEDFPEAGVITIGDLVVEPDFQGRGVAAALCVALHAAYPEYKLSPGAPSELGKSLARHLLKKEPVFREIAALLHPTATDLMP